MKKREIKRREYMLCKEGCTFRMKFVIHLEKRVLSLWWNATIYKYKHTCGYIHFPWSWPNYHVGMFSFLVKKIVRNKPVLKHLVIHVTCIGLVHGWYNDHQCDLQYNDDGKWTHNQEKTEKQNKSVNLLLPFFN